MTDAEKSGLEALRRVRLRIHGKVQGVFYRREAQRKAIQGGLSGWVRNEIDGSVSAEAEGSPESVGTFLRWCRRGPENARVDRVDATEIPPRGGSNFDVEY